MPSRFGGTIKRRALIAARMLPLLVLTACVTVDESPSRGIRVRGRDAQPKAAAPDTPVSLPDGPVATPAIGATTSTARVRVQVLPLGQVSYDGQVLPLVSPDGRFLAVQDGDAPTWETLLAARGATVPLRTSLIVYSLAGEAPVPVVFPTPLPTGVILGRGAGDAGFLVEWPRADASRWIGLADWVSGRITWLVQGDAVNAHAVFTPAGDLLYTRGDGHDEPRTLVLRRGGGSEDVRSESGESYTFPMTTADPDTAYTLIESPSGLDVAAIGIDRGSDGRPSLGAVVSRAHLSGPSAAELAYQVAAGSSPALPIRAAEAPAIRNDLLLLVPRAQRLGRFDLSRAAFDLFPPQTVAAAPAPPGSPGYFAATPDGLVFVTDKSLSDRSAATPSSAPVLGDPYVPRATTDPARPYILIGPVPRDPKRLRIVAMSVAPPE
jgi:hypothetical protein